MTPPTTPPEYNQYFPEAAQEVDEYLQQVPPEQYDLRLYVAKGNPRSTRAIQRIQSLCEERLAGRYRLEIVDIHERPDLLQQDQVFAVPTLIKRRPLPTQRLIGDMSDLEAVIAALGV